MSALDQKLWVSYLLSEAFANLSHCTRGILREVIKGCTAAGTKRGSEDPQHPAMTL